jgi:hypothetical protein
VARARSVYRFILLLVLAPVGAAVTMGALLLFRVDPQAVFLVGFAVKSGLNRVGLPAPNSVGVLSTLVGWWLMIVVVGLAWERRRRQPPPQ